MQRDVFRGRLAEVPHDLQVRESLQAQDRLGREVRAKPDDRGDTALVVVLRSGVAADDRGDRLDHKLLPVRHGSPPFRTGRTGLVVPPQPFGISACSAYSVEKCAGPVVQLGCGSASSVAHG